MDAPLTDNSTDTTPYDLAIAGIRRLASDGDLKDRKTLRLLRDRINALPQLEKLFAPPPSPKEREASMMKAFSETHGVHATAGSAYATQGLIANSAFSHANDPLADEMPVRHQQADAVETHSSRALREVTSALPALMNSMSEQASAQIGRTRLSAIQAKLDALSGLHAARKDDDVALAHEYRIILAQLKRDETDAEEVPATETTIIAASPISVASVV